jgi:hypothetical protein
MASGVDTSSLLSNINWTSLNNWWGKYPAFAVRYFGSCTTACSNWSSGEGTNGKLATGGVLNRIIPMQASVLSKQQTTGSTGYNYGVTDANATCQNIAASITSGELAVPASGVVYVYLDVEAGTILSADYWAGWADTVWHYKVGTSAPLAGSMYCWFGVQPNGSYSADSNVQNALTNASANYPTLKTLCHSFWSNEPEPCPLCSPTATVTWPTFNCFQQIVGGVTYSVCVLVWQYAESGVGCPSTCGTINFAGGQTVDLDDTDSTVGLNYAMVIN